MELTKLEEATALDRLQAAGTEFIPLFERNQLSVEIYRPHLTDKQKPHDRDECYLIISGEGLFQLEDQQTPFKKGDFLFVPAHADHRFTDFSDDFVTWVFFVGPQK